MFRFSLFQIFYVQMKGLDMAVATWILKKQYQMD